MTNCDPKKLAKFLSKKLDVDKELEVLYHLENCPHCWEQLYSATRAQHPHFYKTNKRVKISAKELRGLDQEEQEVTEVA